MCIAERYDEWVLFLLIAIMSNLNFPKNMFYYNIKNNNYEFFKCCETYCGEYFLTFNGRVEMKAPQELLNERKERIRKAVALEKPDRTPVVTLADGFVRPIWGSSCQRPQAALFRSMPKLKM
jgi:hypothetical protein